MNARLSGIEAGRGVAALMVLALHTSDHLFKGFGKAPLGGVFAFGHAGVDFFFVLSGFIILHVHHADIGRPERIWHYLQRRFTRIFPLYWVVLGFTCFAALLVQHRPESLDIAVSALLLPVLQAPLVSVAWTLQHEVVFYAVFAMLVLHRRFGIILFATWLASLLVAQAWNMGAQTDPFLGSFNLHFFFGLAAAWIVRRRGISRPLALTVAGVALFGGIGGLEDLGMINPLWSLVHVGYAFASMLAILGLVELERQGRLFVPRWLAALGGASYAIYLTHILAIGAIWQVMLRLGLDRVLPIWMQFCLLSFGAVLIGWAFSVTVERRLVTVVRSLMAPRPAVKAMP